MKTLLCDRRHRPLKKLRLSVIDRCNLRCQYCMPEEHYKWIPTNDILNFTEITALVDIFTTLGVRQVHLTGGEPLLRAGLEELIRGLAQNTRIDDLSMITNGTALGPKAAMLKAAGLHRITVSLDTLCPERYTALTHRTLHQRVIEGIEEAAAVGFEKLKINSVVMRGRNDDELVDLIEFGRKYSAEVRFIEYMDVGGSTHWNSDQVVTQQEILGQLMRHYGSIVPLVEDFGAPARRYLLPDGNTFGIIASMSRPFCGECDRSRLTANGVWYTCLYGAQGHNLARLLRNGRSRQFIKACIEPIWRQRKARGAEERREMAERQPLSLEPTGTDAYRQMHTLGG